MRYRLLGAVALLVAGPAWAQVPAAPPAGSGGGGPVGPSTTTPQGPTGKTPPGTPGANSVPGQISRDAAGQQVIGKTATPPGAVPGDTGGRGTGATR
jgi:hypothetical protein